MDGRPVQLSFLLWAGGQFSGLTACNHSPNSDLQSVLAWVSFIRHWSKYYDDESSPAEHRLTVRTCCPNMITINYTWWPALHARPMCRDFL